MDPEHIYERLTAAIAVIRSGVGEEPLTEPIDPDANLLDLGLLDSFAIIELVTEVGKVTGRDVDFIEVEPETFFTLRSIADYMLGLDAELAWPDRSSAQ